MDSFISWIGGKKLLRKKIISSFPTGKFDRYIEIFGGAAWVLFSGDKHAKFEVYNDINGELVNLFRCVKYHCNELQRELSLYLNSRELFYDFKEQMDTRGFTDIQRAARYFMLIKISYGSDRRSYGCSHKNMIKIMDYLPLIQTRLNEVIIENKSFDSIIKVYDRPSSLFYLDPPYHGTEKYYDNTFNEENHKLLNSILKGIKGHFILSYNDDKFIRELYKDFKIEDISRNNNLAGRYADQDRSFKELLIKNY
jgi:DNA adenine methylase